MSSAGKFFPERRGAAPSLILVLPKDERRRITPRPPPPPPPAARKVPAAGIGGGGCDGVDAAFASRWSGGALRSPLRRFAAQGRCLSFERAHGVAGQRRRAPRTCRRGAAEPRARSADRARAPAAAEPAHRGADPALPSAIQRGQRTLHSAQ